MTGLVRSIVGRAARLIRARRPALVAPPAAVPASSRSPRRQTLLPMRIGLFAAGNSRAAELLRQAFSAIDAQGAMRVTMADRAATSRGECLQRVQDSDIVFVLHTHSEDVVEVVRCAGRLGKLAVLASDTNLIGDVPALSPAARRAAVEMLCQADVLWLLGESLHERYRPVHCDVVAGRLACPTEFARCPDEQGCDPTAGRVIGVVCRPGDATFARCVLHAIARVVSTTCEPVRVEWVSELPPEPTPGLAVNHIPAFPSAKDLHAYLGAARWSIGIGLCDPATSAAGGCNHDYVDFAARGIAGAYTNTPGYIDVVRDGVTGLCAPPTGDGIAHAVGRLLRDERLRQRIARAALQDASVRYSPRAMQQQLVRELSLRALKRMESASAGPSRVLVVGYDQAVTTHIDAIQPCRALESRGLVRLNWKEPTEATADDARQVDCVYVVRAFQPEVQPLIEWCRAGGVPLVSSWDDDFFALPTDTPIGQYYAHPAVRACLERFLREAELVVAHTPHLTERSRPFNDNVLEAIGGLRPPLIDPREERETASGRVRIGFFGVNPVVSTPFMVDAIRRLKAAYGERIAIELIGAQPSPELASLIDLSVETISPYDAALRLLWRRRWDIGLAPIGSFQANPAKQAVKFRDYAWSGAVLVASRVPTYERVVIDRIHGRLVENTADAWVNAIGELVENPAEREFLAAGAKRLLDAVYHQDETMAIWYQLLWRIAQARQRKERL